MKYSLHGAWLAVKDHFVLLPLIHRNRPNILKDLDEEGRRALVERVLSSDAFTRSKRQQDFLRYIAGKALSGQTDEINEPLIAERVFSRLSGGEADDNIVRVTARHLRAKLQQYFEEEGAGEPYILEIPRGSYVPAFRDRGELSAGTERPGRSLWPRLLPTVFVLAVVSLAVAYAFLWKENRRLQSSRKSTLFRAVLLDDQHRTLVVTSDAGAFVLQKLSRTPLTLDEYVRPDALPLASDSFRASFWKQLTAYQYTSFADVTTVSRVLSAHADQASRIVIRHPRSLQAKDFRTDNVLLLGSLMANPWVQLFERRLDFLTSYDMDVSLAKIVNRSPRKGERAAYDMSEQGVSYVHLAVVPNLDGNGRVILLNATSQPAREVAGELLCDDDVWDRYRLPRPQSAHWEMVLRTEVLQGVPRDVSLMALREEPAQP